MKGFIFKCSDRSEAECLERSLFGADKLAGDEVLSLDPADQVFLLNVESNTLAGVFEATSKGAYELAPDAWRGRYPYQVKVQPHGEVRLISHAKETIDALGLKSHRILCDYEIDVLSRLFSSSGDHTGLWGVEQPSNDFLKELGRHLTNAKKRNGVKAQEEEKPPLESTTLWDYPKQSYGRIPKGDNKYAGVTPAFIIWNLVKRYTLPGDLVVDPMCGSGTTIDVCREEGRRVIGYDIVSVRPDIVENDARRIPLEDNSVDLVFIDSPYGDNIRYNDNPGSIGNLSAEGEEFYDELEKVMREAHRILKPGNVLGWLIGDQWVKKRFTPVGFKVYERLTRYFEPVDVVCVARRSQSSNTGMWHNRAIQFNFYLRGFKYLIIARKPTPQARQSNARRTVRWARYERHRKGLSPSGESLR